MQILPANSTDSALGYYGSVAANADFAGAMQDALDDVSSGDAYSASTALEDDDDRRAQVESPYSRTSSDGVTYTLSEVCFTKNELAELREQLVREGAPVSALRQFDILCEQPDGATLAQVLASLTGRKGEVNIGSEDEQLITNLLNKLDPSGDLAGDALHWMRNGQGQAALDLISEKFADLGGTIDIDKDELLALGRGLGLNQGVLAQLDGSFRGFEQLQVGAAGFRTLMAPANNQFVEEAANAEKLDAALEKTLKQMISKARNRMEKEKEAAELESRKIQLSRLKIDNTVLQNSRETLDETIAAGQGGIDGQMTQAAQNRDGARNTQNAQNSQTGLNGQIAQDMRGAQDGKNLQPANDARQEFTGQDFSDQNQTGKDQAWNELLANVQTKPAQTSSGPAASSFVYSMLQGQTPLNTQTAGLEQMELNPQMQQMSRQMAVQVEQGMLSAMRDGATRMDLQLHPAELGNVAITLIARNGEVSAQIRSEKSETAEMLTRQLEAIRVNLEQQGIKVDKLEVAMQNQDQNSSTDSSWQDMQQHNARQEQQARQAEYARMRNLAALREKDGNAINHSLEQSLHILGDTARNAGRALNVVA